MKMRENETNLTFKKRRKKRQLFMGVLDAEAALCLAALLVLAAALFAAAAEPLGNGCLVAATAAEVAGTRDVMAVRDVVEGGTAAAAAAG